MNIDIYTDGGCREGIGGWGVVIGDIEYSGGATDTTNNRMELTAAIEAIKRTNGSITIHTDSNYVKQGITEWCANWIRNG